LSAKEAKELEKRGVIAEIGAMLLDQNTQVADDFSARCIAITADQLRRVGRVVLVVAAAAEFRARAALAARTGFVAEMITDRELAEALLAEKTRQI
jgi:DNA-binding transcriptional regulator LsrR (DeoR family)